MLLLMLSRNPGAIVPALVTRALTVPAPLNVAVLAILRPLANEFVPPCRLSVPLVTAKSWPLVTVADFVINVPLVNANRLAVLVMISRSMEIVPPANVTVPVAVPNRPTTKSRPSSVAFDTVNRPTPNRPTSVAALVTVNCPLVTQTVPVARDALPATRFDDNRIAPPLIVNVPGEPANGP